VRALLVVRSGWQETEQALCQPARERSPCIVPRCSKTLRRESQVQEISRSVPRHSHHRSAASGFVGDVRRRNAVLARRLQHRKPPMRDPGTPEHPLRRPLRWILAALVAWWLLWILLRGAPI
jgi:hypothetical protein